jgi:hypothetical protein
VLEAVFILLEFPSHSRRIFIGSHSLPPLWFAVSVLHPHPPVTAPPPREGLTLASPGLLCHCWSSLCLHALPPLSVHLLYTVVVSDESTRPPSVSPHATDPNTWVPKCHHVHVSFAQWSVHLQGKPACAHSHLLLPLAPFLVTTMCATTRARWLPRPTWGLAGAKVE